MRALLERKQAELAAELRRREGLQVSLHADHVEHSQAVATRETAALRLEVVRQTLRDVQDALLALEGGYYGTCQECDEAIAPRRLAALPWAQRCLACAERAEQRAAAQARHSEEAA